MEEPKNKNQNTLCPIIILAAGASRRMGQPKQLMLWKGETLISRIVRVALEVKCGPVVVVLGAHSEEIEKEIANASVSIAINDSWELGMGTSLNRGLHEVEKIAPEASAIVLLVADQPYVTKEIIQERTRKKPAPTQRATKAAQTISRGPKPNWQKRAPTHEPRNCTDRNRKRR